MLYRIFYDSDEGDSGWETVEAPNIAAARRMIENRLSGIQGLELGTVEDITPSPAGELKGDEQKKKKEEEEEEEEEEVVEIPNELGGGGGTDWEALYRQQEKDFKRMMDEAEKRHQERMDEQTESFNKRMENTVKTYTDQLNKWSNAIDMGKGAGFDATKGKGQGPSDYSMYGFEGFNPNERAVDSMSPDDRRMLLEMQSPLASFRQGMAAGLGGGPQNYLAKNYLERFMNPAQTAYSVLGGMGGSEGQDFQSFVQNLFSGGSPRASLGKMLGGGLEQLAGTGRAELAAMDPSERAYFEGLTRPDITQEGGRANIEDVLGLAYGTQAQRFSPLILQQMRRGLPSQDELWADFQTQAMTGGGDPNFARFVQQQFGL